MTLMNSDAANADERLPGESLPQLQRPLTATSPFRWLEPLVPILHRHGMAIHFFDPASARVGHELTIGNRTYISFSSYDYLGFASDPRVAAEASAAIQAYGTSSSASRIASGELLLHRQLERELADLVGAEDALVFVSGHATNVTTLRCLLGPADVIFYDVLCHNSIQEGIRLSGATAFRFAHNNVSQARSLLRRRKKFRHALIITEGVFSMDGDIAPIPELIELKREHDAFLMVDEAHSMGVIGPEGRGVCDHFALRSDDVDIWMGTLSKAFASCGGYIAGSRELVNSLRFSAPGFVFSCGISPPNAAAALAAVRLMKQEPERVRRLDDNVQLFKSLALRAGLNLGTTDGSAVIPIIVGCSLTCLMAAHLLYEAGIIAHASFYPAVPLDGARLRFFLTAMHNPNEIEHAVQATAEAIGRARELASLEQIAIENLHKHSPSAAST